MTEVPHGESGDVQAQHPAGTVGKTGHVAAHGPQLHRMDREEEERLGHGAAPGQQHGQTAIHRVHSPESPARGNGHPPVRISTDQH